MRSHDQFNTTIYSLNDRYRGVGGGRDVIFREPTICCRG
jgi:formate dehydrogenase major subunit